jgi:hypothetical protein
MSNYHNNMSIIHFYQVPLLIAQGVIQTFQPLGALGYNQNIHQFSFMTNVRVRTSLTYA